MEGLREKFSLPIKLLILPTCFLLFVSAVSTTPAFATPQKGLVSYNQGRASMFHAPISSAGLMAIDRSGAELIGITSNSNQASTYNYTSSNLTPSGSIRFITDSSYMPQSETSLAVDPTNTSRVVGGFNDGRFFFCPFLPAGDCPSGFTESLSGFTTSSNGGKSVAKSGDIPGILTTEKNLTSGAYIQRFLVPWGDPSLAAGPGGIFYYASLAIDPLTGANGIMIAKSNSSLWNPSVGCVTPARTPWANACWTATLVAGNMTFQCRKGFCFNTSFEDKDLIAVDYSPTSPYYGNIYVSWDHFYSSGSSSSYLARCDPSLACTMLSGGAAPVVSGADPFVAFTTPTVGIDGRVYVTWCNYGTSTSFGPVTCRIASSPPGGMSFGRPANILSFMGARTMFPAYTVLQGFATEQFRVASIPALASDGRNANNLYFAIDLCTGGSYYAFNLTIFYGITDNPGNCGLSSIVFSRSTDGGATWSTPTIISNPGVNFQPFITVDPSSGKVVVVYYTTQFDPFNHLVDVVAIISPDSGTTFNLKRITSVSDEINSDPSMYNYLRRSGAGGSFIVPQFGDYFQAVAISGKIFVLYTGNYVAEQGVFQTDPFLAVVQSTFPTLKLSPAPVGRASSPLGGTSSPDPTLNHAPPGTVVPFNATGFTPGSSFTLSLNWGGLAVTLATGTVSPAGYFAGEFIVPNIQSQVYTITASDSSGNQASTSFGVEQISLTPLETSVSQLSQAVSSGFSSVQSSLSSLSSQVSGGFSSVQSSLSSLSSQVSGGFSSVQSSLSSLSNSVKNGLASLSTSVNGTASAVANLSTQITHMLSSIENAVNGATSQLTSLNGAIGSFRSDVTSEISNIAYYVIIAIIASVATLLLSLIILRRSRSP